MRYSEYLDLRVEPERSTAEELPTMPDIFVSGDVSEDFQMIVEHTIIDLKINDARRFVRQVLRARFRQGILIEGIRNATDSTLRLSAQLQLILGDSSQPEGQGGSELPSPG